MAQSDGPTVKIQMTCFGCKHCQTVSYYVQSDSGSDVYCKHPETVARHGGQQHVGDTRWDTPGWCPARPAAILALANELIADLPVEGGLTVGRMLELMAQAQVPPG